MNSKPADQYLESAVFAASPVKLVAMLFDGAIRFLGRAKAASEAKNAAESARFLTRAQDIIAELNAALDVRRGGEIARDLARLYDFAVRRLADARIKKDAAAIGDAIRVLTPLKEGFDALARTGA